VETGSNIWAMQFRHYDAETASYLGALEPVEGRGYEGEGRRPSGMEEPVARRRLP
jgi:hypothetical protein